MSWGNWKRFSISLIVAVALLAFSLCRVHPAHAGDHETPGETGSSCEIAEPLSVVLPSPPVATPFYGLSGDAGSDWDFLPALPSQDISRGRFFAFSTDSDPPILLSKRYEFFCTYRI